MSFDLTGATFRTNADDGRTLTVYVEADENITFSLDGGATKYTAASPASISGIVARVEVLENDVSSLNDSITAHEASLQGLTTRVDSLDTAVLGSTVAISGMSAQLGLYVKKIVTITDNTTTNATLSLTGGTRYVFTQPLVGLTVSAIENTDAVSEIEFSSDSTGINALLPTTVKFIGSTATFESGKSYVINVQYNELVYGELL